jgi:hypothetical protein
MDSPYPPPPQIPEHPFTDIPGLSHSKLGNTTRNFRRYLPLFILIGLLPVVTGAVMLRQLISGNASNRNILCRQKIARVSIDPGTIGTYIGSAPTQMSALAYDDQGHPIWKNVSYEWGMSSTNTVGNIIPKNQVATFKPLNIGTGNVYVSAVYCSQKAGGSARITVSAPQKSPTPLPRRLRK